MNAALQLTIRTTATNNNDNNNNNNNNNNNKRKLQDGDALSEILGLLCSKVPQSAEGV